MDGACGVFLARFKGFPDFADTACCGESGSAAASIGLHSEEPQGTVKEAEQAVLGGALQTLTGIGVERVSGYRSAGDGDSMAPQRIQAFLAMEVSKEAWPSAGLSRNPGIDPKDVAGKPVLGRAAD